MVLHQNPALLPIIKPNYLQTRKRFNYKFIAYSVLIWFIA